MLQPQSFRCAVNPYFFQCSGSGTFLDESRSLDPYTGLRIRIWILLFPSVAFKAPTKNKLQSFLLITFFRYIYIFISFQRQQLIKKSQNSWNQAFLNLCLFLEGSGSVQITTDPDPGCPKTYRSYGSGSGLEHCFLLPSFS